MLAGNDVAVEAVHLLSFEVLLCALPILQRLLAVPLSRAHPD